jgi:hypothetical protein
MYPSKIGTQRTTSWYNTFTKWMLGCTSLLSLNFLKYMSTEYSPEDAGLCCSWLCTFDCCISFQIPSLNYTLKVVNSLGPGPHCEPVNVHHGSCLPSFFSIVSSHNV